MLLMRQVTDTLTYIEQAITSYGVSFTKAQVARHFFLSHLKALVDKLYSRSSETLHSELQSDHVAMMPGATLDVYDDADFVVQKRCKLRNKSLDPIKVRSAFMAHGLTRQQAETLVAECTILPGREISYTVIPNMPGRE